MSELQRQRLRYLIEHGEVYPPENHRVFKVFMFLAVVIIALQLVGIFLSL